MEAGLRMQHKLGQTRGMATWDVERSAAEQHAAQGAAAPGGSGEEKGPGAACEEAHAAEGQPGVLAEGGEDDESSAAAGIAEATSRLQLGSA